MLKYLWACALTITTTLSAELIGNLDFQFPPSRYEWILLTDDALLRNFISFFTNESIIDDSVSTQIFTHREGDALEILWVVQDNDAIAMDDDQQIENESNGNECCETIRRLFPNHGWQSFEIHEDLAIYGLSDGTSNLLHGYARSIEEGSQNTVIFYLSTSVETEQSRAMWLHALESATLR